MKLPRYITSYNLIQPDATSITLKHEKSVLLFITEFKLSELPTFMK